MLILGLMGLIDVGLFRLVVEVLFVVCVEDFWLLFGFLLFMISIFILLWCLIWVMLILIRFFYFGLYCCSDMIVCVKELEDVCRCVWKMCLINEILLVLLLLIVYIFFNFLNFNKIVLFDEEFWKWINYIVKILWIYV